MILPARRMESVACIRFETPPKSGKYRGCGKGWVQDAHPKHLIHGPRCPDCGWPLLVTGAFLVAEIPR